MMVPYRTSKRARVPARIAGLLAAFLIAHVPTVGAEKVPATWLEPQEPIRLLGNTYYVGTRGLSSILITSDEGHVLIDGGVMDAAPMIAANIEKLGFKLRDVRAILHSHAHFDHVGGLAELQELTGADVVSSKHGAKVLRQGRAGPDDPQFESAEAFPAIEHVSTIGNGETLQIGHIAITGYYTPGHTPGGMSWSWYSCDKLECANFVYADSLTAISDPDFRYTDGTRYRTALSDFRWSFRIVRNLYCDILLTPHPEASDLWGRLARRDAGQRDALYDMDACRAYSNRARQAFEERLAREMRERRQ
jgi:metallo-beta-lactamase class B